MKHEVFWKNPGYKIRKPLTQDITCDYLIVGGGVTGVSLAYFLGKNSAKNIVLIEKDTVASGATGKAAGTLVVKAELDMKDMLKNLGRKKGLLFWKANHEVLSTIKKIIEREKIDCDYEPQDTIYGSTKRDHDSFILDEYAVEKNIEKSTQLMTGEKLRDIINTPLFRYAILSKNHGLSVDPLRFTQNLSVVIEKYGVNVFERTPLLGVKGNKATTLHGTITFKKLVMAIDSETRHGRVRKRNSTLIVTKPLTDKQVASIGLVPKKIVWDAKNDYHYFKIMPDNRMLIGYGDRYVNKKHRETMPHEIAVKRTKKFMKKLFPGLDLEFDYGWSGSYGVTKSRMPLLDIRGNIWSIAGAGSQVACVMAAKHLAHKLLNKHSGLDDFFEN